MKADLINTITVILLFDMVCYSALILWLAGRLRSRHNDVWRSVGEPGLFRSSIRTSWLFGNWFLFSGAYRGLQDRAINIVIGVLRLLAVAFSCGVALAIYLTWT